MKIDYTNLSFTQLIDKIEANRFFDLPRMVREAFKRLLTRVEALEDAPAPTGNFIPLTGTEVDSPVSGDIEFDGYVGNALFFPDPNDNDTWSSIFNEDGITKLQSTNGIFYKQLEFSGVDQDSFNIVSSNPNFKGFSGGQDFTPNITDLDYTQKKYVDERGSVFNSTTSVLSASDLNTTYPNAKDGFSVIAPNVVGGGKYYIKAGAGWVYQQILAVV